MSVSIQKDDFIISLEKRFSLEPEFLSSVIEIYTSLKPKIHLLPDFNKYFEYLLFPQNVYIFKIAWEDDSGIIRINTGYRVHYCNATGPFKGGLRFSPTVNLSVIKFLAFEQTFKNTLTGLPMGGAKGGSDFDPKNKSKSEIRRFCKAFAKELFLIGIGKTDGRFDTPAGDIGVGEFEIGIIFGELKKLNKDTPFASITGKPLSLGGSHLRPEATGYGLVYILVESLKKTNDSIEGKTVIISGSGNVSLFALEKCIEMGSKVVTVSDSQSVMFKREGFNENDLKILKEDKFSNRKRLAEINIENTEIIYDKIENIKNLKADIYLPCATQGEIDEEGANKLTNMGVNYVAEGANMPSTIGAINRFKENCKVFLPSKAANAGGVSVSGLEMIQNKTLTRWSREKVNEKLKAIMKNIFLNIDENSKKFMLENDFVFGANYTGYKNVVDALKEAGEI